MEIDKKIAVVIVAGGTGDRVGGNVNKQWKIISGKPVLDWAISKFKNHSRIIPDQFPYNICPQGPQNHRFSIKIE